MKTREKKKKIDLAHKEATERNLGNENMIGNTNRQERHKYEESRES